MSPEYQLPQKFVDGVMTHINADHTRDLLDILHALAGCAWAEDATLVRLDTHGIDLLARGDGREEQMRVPFDSEITAPPQFRRAMIDLCQRAHFALTGEMLAEDEFD